MKKENSLRKGIHFLVSNILKKEPMLLVMVILCVLLTLTSSILLVYIPPYAVAVLDGNLAASPMKNRIHCCFNDLWRRTGWKRDDATLYREEFVVSSFFEAARREV